MADDQKPGPAVTAQRLEEATRELVSSTLHLPRPSDINAVLGSLSTAQGALAQAYEQLAVWHSRAVHGVHHAGEHETDDSENPAWVRAEFALHEAAQYSANAADALGRARSATGVARWFDEIMEDE
ncbi:hypothetical protein [Salinibacterium sp. TMP30]|uniref:hypothetical protein n=1 Tax=Salinibacterium sp. TMP30 TaxID=3138237 RepID=UPI0031391A0F